ncbi:MAG TPA: hypothetical protein VME66_13300 [Candidatus Acidoferrales bacterium]|nr:hypothetical protein [Candidatus Acidoferrales bacterium]
MSDTSETASTLQEKTEELTEQAKSFVAAQVDQQSTTLGNTIRERANDLRAIRDQLRELNILSAASLADQLSMRVDQFGSYLSESSGDQLLDDLDDFARRQPWALAAAGLAAGLAISRSIKASSAARYRRRYGKYESYHDAAAY